MRGGSRGRGGMRLGRVVWVSRSGSPARVKGSGVLEKSARSDYGRCRI
jgi:hypothetical protein